MRGRTPCVALMLAACAGGPEVDPLELEGAVFGLDVGGMKIPGADPAIVIVIQSFFGGDMWMYTHRVEEDAFAIRTGFAGGDGRQDPCIPTSDLPMATLDGLDFSFGPEGAEFQTTGGTFVFEGFTGGGSFSDDGSRIVDMTLQGIVDMRHIEGFAGLGDGDLLCRMLSSYGMPCVPCANDEVFCFDLYIENLQAPRLAEPFRVISYEEATASCPKPGT